MNLLSTFIHRPVASVLIAIAIVLLGILAYLRLPVAALPQADIPTIVVRASLPGASPESMSATVAMPLERAMMGVSGVKAINSSSSQSSAQVVLNFDLATDINEAAREVQAAINAAMSQLPSGMPNPPEYFKVNPSQSPIYYLALSSEHLSAGKLYEIASDLLQPNLAQLSGVGEVSIDGASMPAVRITLNPNALISQGVTLEQVREAIDKSNRTQALGVVETEQLRWQVALSSSNLKTAADFANLTVHKNAQAIVRLKDVAEVQDSVENRYVSGFHNGKPAVIIKISRQPNANTVATIEKIKERLPELQMMIPEDAQLATVMDGSKIIRAGLDEARDTLLLSIILVVIVVAIMLGRVQSALVPAVALIVVLIGASNLVYLAGFSLNNLSIMAVIVAIGLVVDDAIVVLENIERHIEQGEQPIQAALKGIQEVGTTLIAMNLALVVIFISILFMGGVIERLFREFSLTLVFIVILSVVISLILTPSLSARCLKPLASYQHQALYQYSHRWMQSLNRAYLISLKWMLKHSYLIIVLWVSAIVGSAYIYQTLPKRVLPEQDTGQIDAFIRGDDGFSFQIMQPKIAAFSESVLKDPAVQNVVGTSGGSGGTTNSSLMVSLKPKAERDGQSAHEVAERLKQNAPWQAGAIFSARVKQELELDDPFGGSGQDYTLLLQSDNVALLREWVPKVALAMQKLPQLEEVESMGDEGAQHVTLEIDREAARRLGVNIESISSVLNNSFSQRQISTIYDQTQQFHVVMEVDKRFTEQPEALANIRVPNQQGESVPLSNFATWSYGITNDRVYRRNQYAAMGIGYVVKPEYTNEQADAAIRSVLPEVMLPNEIFMTSDKEAEEQSLQSGLSTPVLVLVVILMIYIVLGVTYESVLHPFTILSTIPAVALGALLTLWTFGFHFTLIALLGMFLLIGVVVKNAILLIDFTLMERRAGKSAYQAVLSAAELRFRPILMTNTATLLGTVPLALSWGEGAELRQPLGVVIVGGLALGQLLTLYTTPVLYLVLEKCAEFFKRSKNVHAIDLGK